MFFCRRRAPSIKWRVLEEARVWIQLKEVTSFVVVVADADWGPSTDRQTKKPVWCGINRNQKQTNIRQKRRLLFWVFAVDSGGAQLSECGKTYGAYHKRLLLQLGIPRRLRRSRMDRGEITMYERNIKSLFFIQNTYPHTHTQTPVFSPILVFLKWIQRKGWSLNFDSVNPRKLNCCPWDNLKKNFCKGWLTAY